MMYACLHAPDFAVQAASRLRPELHPLPIAILAGEPPLETIFALNALARERGVAVGMSRLQAESFPGLRLHRRSLAEEASAQSVLLECAAAFSPRLEVVSLEYTQEPGGTVVLDIRGTQSLFGDPRQLATAARGKALDHGLRVNIAVSENFHAAVCAARGCSGITLLTPAAEAAVLGPLLLEVLDLSPEMSETFKLWGIHNCAELAALPERELIARIGQQGKRLRALARGEQPHLLVPVEADFRSELVETMELEYPVEELEPLLFLLARLLDSLLMRVQQRALAIASVQVTLTLDAKVDGRALLHTRTVRPALPSQEARTLLKLVQLDLETHPPQAAILAVEVRVESARPHRAQHGLFLPQAPEPGRLEVLLARLRKLLGENRVGAPQLMDSHHPEAFRVSAFAPPGLRQQSTSVHSTAPAVLRVCRPPQAIHVTIHAQKPAGLLFEGSYYSVLHSAGPWRSSGEWWSESCWCREEWDVELAGQTRMISRIAYDPASNCWYMQGVYD